MLLMLLYSPLFGDLAKEILFIVPHTVAASCVNTNGFLKETSTHTAAATATTTTLFSSSSSISFAVWALVLLDQINAHEIHNNNNSNNRNNNILRVMMIIEGELEPQKQLITTENAENAHPPPTRNLLLQQQPGCSDSQVPSFCKIVTKSMASRGHLELPRRFVMDNAAKFGLDVTMRGRSKEAMPVKFVMVYRKDTRDRSPRIVVRAASWMPFFKANGLKQGQQVLFSLRAISYFEVEIIADDHDKLMSSSQVPKLEQKRDGHDIHGDDDDDDDDLDEVQLHTPLVRSITTSAEADQEESATAMRDRAFAQMDLFLAQHAVQPMISSTTTATPASCCCSYHHHQHMISSRPPKKSAHKFEAASFQSLTSCST